MHLRFTPLAAASLLALATTTPVAALAQTPTDGWHWDASLYFWLPAVGGQTVFPADGGSSIGVSAEQVIDALKFTLMGNLSVRNTAWGAWGAWTDLVYADFGASRSGSRDFSIGGKPLPGGVDGRLELDLKATAWTLAGSYALVSTPAHQVDLLAGARLLDLNQSLNWAIDGNLGGTGLRDRNGSSSVDLQNWDAVIGIQGRAALGSERKWFVPYHLDIGSGQSDLTWQANLGLGYRFGWGSAVASYRYLAYEMKSGQAIQSLNFSGPVIGLAWQW